MMRAKTATFRPLSTSRWIRPVAINACSSLGGTPSRTPSTIPRSIAACGGGTAAFSAAVYLDRSQLGIAATPRSELVTSKLDAWSSR